MTSAVRQTESVRGELSELAPPFDVGLFVSRYGGAAGLKFKAGTVLYSQGEAADCLYYIQEGQVQFTVVSAQGREAIFTFLGPGDFCGVGMLVGEKSRVATATCKTDCVVARLERASVVRAVREDPQFAGFYVSYVLNRTIRLRDNLISRIFDTSERRLARILLGLANSGQDRRERIVIVKLDQEALARMVGTTRSRINHFMNKFRKLGYVDYNGEIAVHSSLLNVLLHDRPADPADDESVA